LSRPSEAPNQHLRVDRSRQDVIDLNPEFPRINDNKVENLATQWVHTFNQNMINEVRFGFNRSNGGTSTPRQNSDFDVDSLGIGKFRVATDGNRKFVTDFKDDQIGEQYDVWLRAQGVDRNDPASISSLTASCSPTVARCPTHAPRFTSSSIDPEDCHGFQTACDTCRNSIS
jgi:hypothetical protein